MPIEEDFTNTLRAELSNREPDTRLLLTGAIQRGRRRRRRRASLLSVAALVLLAGTTGVIVQSLPQAAVPARLSVVTVVPATPPSSSSPSAAATTSPSPAGTPRGWLQRDQIEARLKALLPAGITISVPTDLQGDSVEQSNFELDDGNGKSFLAVQAQWLPDPTSARAYLRTVTTARPDGILFQIEQIPYQRGIARNQVVNLLSPGGFSLVINLSQAAVPDQAATTRARPILSAAQLTALATSPEWEQGR